MRQIQGKSALLRVSGEFEVTEGSSYWGSTVVDLSLFAISELQSVSPHLGAKSVV